jgi:hypothetical protein
MYDCSIRPIEIGCGRDRAIHETVLEVNLQGLMFDCCNVNFLAETDPKGGGGKGGGESGGVAGIDEDLDTEHMALKVCFCFDNFLN